MGGSFDSNGAGGGGVLPNSKLKEEHPMALDFPILPLMDEQACYDVLVPLLHPDGLACPRCAATEGLGVHRRHRRPVLDYQCAACGRVFNAFTATAFHKTCRRPILSGTTTGQAGNSGWLI